MSLRAAVASSAAASGLVLALASCSLLVSTDGLDDGDVDAASDAAAAGMALDADAVADQRASDALVDAATPSGPNAGTPLLWFAADQGISATGASIARWEDRSGGGHDALQSDPSKQPMLVPHSLNGKPAVAFDGATSYLSFVANIDGLTSLTFAVVSSSADATQNGGTNMTMQDCIHWNETAFWGTTFLASFQADFGGRFGTTQENNTLRVLRDSSIGTAFTLTMMAHDQTNDRVWSNGKLMSLATGKLAAIAGTATNGQIGSGDDLSFFSGSIAEILVYPVALSDDQRSSVQTYIHAKYFPDLPAFPTN